LLLAAVVVVIMAVAGGLLLVADEPAQASTLSRAAAGWLGARRYLEERDTRVVLIDHDLEEPVGDGVLVLAFPWQRAAFDDVEGAGRRHLQAGGALVLAYTDGHDPAQAAVMEEVELHWTPLRPKPPLTPRRWRAYASEEWDLAGDPAAPPRP